MHIQIARKKKKDFALDLIITEKKKNVHTHTHKSISKSVYTQMKWEKRESMTTTTTRNLGKV